MRHRSVQIEYMVFGFGPRIRIVKGLGVGESEKGYI